MLIRLFVLSDSPARFLAACTNYGAALRCQWSGPGDAAGSNPLIEFHRNAYEAYRAANPALGLPPFEMGPFATGSLVNVALDGLLPPGHSPEQFSNPDEIIARVTQGTKDPVAQKRIDDLQGTVASIDTEVGRLRDWANSGSGV